MRVRWSFASCFFLCASLFSTGEGATSLNTSILPKKCVVLQNLERCWWTYTPASILSTNASVPIVIDMHGWNDDVDGHIQRSGWKGVADKEGFVVIWPQGRADSWNAGSCCGIIHEKGLKLDDVEFIRSIINCQVGLTSRAPLDLTRIYLAGHSNGCAMAQRMAAQSGSLIAAVGCHSLYLLSSFAADYKPVSILEVHGTKDQTVGYDQETMPQFSFVPDKPSALGNLDQWSKANGCEGRPEFVNMTTYGTHTYTTCKGETQVALVTIYGGTHNPFKGKEIVAGYDKHALRYVEKGILEVDTTKMAWDFVKQFRSATAVGMLAVDHSCMLISGDSTISGASALGSSGAGVFAAGVGLLATLLNFAGL